MRSFLSFQFFLWLMVAVVPAQAAEFKSGQELRIQKAHADDLYLAAEQIILEAPLQGDMVAAGSIIVLNDSIFGDALLGSGELTLEGYLDDDLRAMGGQLDIKGHIHGDLIIFGGEVKLYPGARVDGDVVIFGGEVELSGTMAGNLRVYSGDVELAGPVGGDAILKGGEIEVNSAIGGKSLIVAGDLQLGTKASFKGPIRYWTQRGEVDFGEAASEVEFDEELGEAYEENQWDGDGFTGLAIYGLLASLLIAALLIFGFGKYFERAAHYLQSDFLKSFGYGALYFLGVPVLTLFLFIIVIGIPLGALLGTLYLFSSLFAATITAVTLTYWLDNRNDHGWGKWLKLLVSGGAFLILYFMLIIPFAGWLASLVLVCAAFGSLLRAIFIRR